MKLLRLTILQKIDGSNLVEIEIDFSSSLDLQPELTTFYREMPWQKMSNRHKIIRNYQINLVKKNQIK